MSIASDMLRGNTDMIILAHLTGQESYGYAINKRIREESGGRFDLKEATLYGAFRRLEEAGYVSFYWGDESTGARRRYYRITSAGQKAYARYEAEWFDAVALITALLAGAANAQRPKETRAPAGAGMVGETDGAQRILQPGESSKREENKG